MLSAQRITSATAMRRDRASLQKSEPGDAEQHDCRSDLTSMLPGVALLTLSATSAHSSRRQSHRKDELVAIRNKPPLSSNAVDVPDLHATPHSFTVLPF